VDHSAVHLQCDGPSEIGPISRLHRADTYLPADRRYQCAHLCARGIDATGVLLWNLADSHGRVGPQKQRESAQLPAAMPSTVIYAVALVLFLRFLLDANPTQIQWHRGRSPSLRLSNKLRRAATPELASLIQDALRRRNELAAYARHEIYRELATYLQNEISPFPDELVEMLSDEQYLMNAAGVLFGDQRLSRVHG